MTRKITVLLLILCAVFAIVLIIVSVYSRYGEWLVNTLAENVSHLVSAHSNPRGNHTMSFGGYSGGGGDDERLPLLFYTQSELAVFAAFMNSILAIEHLYISAKQRLKPDTDFYNSPVQEKRRNENGNVLRLRGGGKGESDDSSSEESASFIEDNSEWESDDDKGRAPYSTAASNSSHTATKLDQRKGSRQVKRNKKDKFTSTSHVNSLVSSTCCTKKCLSSVLTFEEIEECLELFWDKSEEEQRVFILNQLYFTHSKGESGKPTYEYKVNGKQICQKAWKACYGISNGRFFNLKTDFENGRRSAASLRMGRYMRSKRRLNAKTWFENFVSTMADSMPNERKKHLPSCMTKEKVYKIYVEETAKSGKGGKPLGYSQFRNMWHSQFSEVLIPKVNRFTKCGVCTIIKEHIHKLKGKARRLSWIEKKTLHLQQQANERKKYYKHQSKARKMPDKYLSIITDGMDSSKTNIPHFKVKSKIEGEHGGFMKTHVTGVLSHGHNLAWAVIDLLRWPSDANPTINILMVILQDIAQQRGNLPPVFYWQMDNCFRDCKNIYILGFCAFLVMAGVFQKMFSRISDALKKADAATLEALRKLISSSYTPKPTTVYIDNIYDFKTWIRPHVPTLQHHGTPHVFRFTKNEKGEVEMVYRIFAGGARKKWLPEEKPFVMMTDIPAGYPPLLKPENSKNASPAEMEKSLEHLSSRLTCTEMEWWRAFLGREIEKRATWGQMTEDDYYEAGETFDIGSLCPRKVQREDQEENEDHDVLKAEEEILKHLNKEHRPVKQTKGPTASTQRGKENKDIDMQEPPRKKKKRSKK